MTKVLVVGCEGYIGQFTCKALMRTGFEIVKCDWKLNNSIETYPIDNAISTIIDLSGHIDARESVTEPLSYYLNNVANKIRFLSNVRHSNIKNYIFASSVAAQYPNLNPYASTKVMFEKILHDCWQGNGRKHAVLRYSNVSGAAGDSSMGENHHIETHLIPRLCLSALNKLVAPVDIYGDCVRDYVHVEDVAWANVKALQSLMREDSGSFTCDIGGNNEYSTKIIISLCKTHGINPSVNYLPANRNEPEALPINLQPAKEYMCWEPSKGIGEIIESSHRWYKNA